MKVKEDLNSLVIVSAVFALLVVARRLASQPHVSALSILVTFAIVLITGLLISIPIVALAKRFPVTATDFKKNLLLQFTFSLILSALGIALFIGLRLLIQPQWRHGFVDRIELFENFFLKNFHLGVVTSWMILGLNWAGDYYKQYRERDIAAKELAIKSSHLEKLLLQAELNALKMQLNPHFLFNVLNTISILMLEDVAVAHKMLGHLSNFLRVTLQSSNKHLVPLSEEIRFIENYLEIEKVRFEESLIVEIEIDPTASDVAVPTLILQPIVENAIRHGISQKRTPGFIKISAVRNYDRLELSVYDNGLGLVAKQQSSNLVSTNQSTGGVGLANVRQRLQQIYAGQHYFNIANAAEGGCMVTINIPCNAALSWR